MDTDSDLALNAAVKNNKENDLQFLLSQFPDQVGPQLNSLQLLHDAIRNSALKIIPILLDHGADINGCLKRKCNLTQVVDVNVLELLLSRGADPNVKIGSRLHTYPIHFFLLRCFKRTLRKGRGSDLSSSVLSNVIKGFVECLLKHGGQVDLKDGRGQTALHIAAREDPSVSVLQLLIDNGADVNTTDHVGKTPLWNAVNYQKVDQLQCLINNGADINLVYKFNSKNVLFDAADETFLKVLIDKGVRIKTFGDECPLNSLLEKRHIGIEHVKSLIKAGCDVNHENKNGYTVLIHAAEYVDIKLLELLLQEGADVNALGKKFPYLTAITALLSNLWDDPELATSCINFLIDNKANIDDVHPGVIYVIMTSGCLSLIPRFISRGLAPTHFIINTSPRPWRPYRVRETPLMMALRLNQLELARYFICNKYLLDADIGVLRRDQQACSEEMESAFKRCSFWKRVMQNPLSLETLCFIVVSETLGSTRDRRLKVQKLGLSRPLQDLLLFKNATAKEIKNLGTRNLDLFEQSFGRFVEPLNTLQVTELDDMFYYLESD